MCGCRAASGGYCDCPFGHSDIQTFDRSHSHTHPHLRSRSHRWKERKFQQLAKLAAASAWPLMLAAHFSTSGRLSHLAWRESAKCVWSGGLSAAAAALGAGAGYGCHRLGGGGGGCKNNFYHSSKSRELARQLTKRASDERADDLYCMFKVDNNK